MLISTDIKSIKNEIPFSIFPNPAGEIVTVVFSDYHSSPLNINLYDITGKKVLSKTVNPELRQLELNIGSFEAGMYFIAIDDQKNIKRQMIEIIR